MSSVVLENLLKSHVLKKYPGMISSGEVGLSISSNGFILPCGIYGRWEGI